MIEDKHTKKSFKERTQETFESFKEKYSKHPVQYTLVVLGLVYLSGLISYVFNFKKGKKFHILLPLIEWCTSIRGLVILLIITGLAIFVWLYRIKPRQEVTTGVDDTRNFKYAETGDYGTARPLTEKDLEDILEFKSIEETEGIILGETYDGKVVSIPTAKEFKDKAKRKKWTQEDKTNNTRNRNILVVGSPGTMKSRAIIMNQILQAMRIGDSMIVTDPKGELYEKTYNILTEHGYDVKMFNLVNQLNSDSWNPLNELTSETEVEHFMNDGYVVERAMKDSTYAKIFAETVVSNAKENSKGEQFWDDNAMNFFKACLMFKNSESLGSLYDFVSSKTLTDFQEEFYQMEDVSVARRAYNIFSQSSEQVRGQIINGLGIMIDVFQDQKIRDITNTSEIEMTKPAREKCAYFVITSDQHRTFDYLAVLFWTMAFIKLVEYIDKNRDENGDPTTRPVHLLLDEFPNIGAIPDFNRKLSTVRSRLLYSTIVIQNIPQLMNRYPNGMHEEIFCDCDFVVFLGCNDNTTADYMSQLTGTASIQVESLNRVYDKTRPVLNQGTEIRKVRSVGQRTVMNKDEIRSIKNTDLLIFIRGTKSVYQCKKFDYSKHIFAKDLKMYKIKNHVPEWREAQIEKEKERLERERQIEEKNKQEAEEKAKAVQRAKEEQEIKKKKDEELNEEIRQQTFIEVMGGEQGDLPNPSDLRKAAEDMYGSSETNETLINDSDVDVGDQLNFSNNLDAMHKNPRTGAQPKGSGIMSRERRKKRDYAKMIEEQESDENQSTTKNNNADDYDNYDMDAGTVVADGFNDVTEVF